VNPSAETGGRSGPKEPDTECSAATVSRTPGPLNNDTLGNLAENPQAHLFLIDYTHRRRVKLWGEARVVEDDAALTARLMPTGYRARPSQVILFSVTAWDANCPQNIPQRFEAADVAVRTPRAS
jgi:predicted pyridoxine 5'-phosphate oxidase superfamily flavin-nucleotide-binding protein